MEAAYLDTHCHVDRYRDPVGTLRAGAERDVGVVAVTELPSQFQRLALRLGRRPGTDVALGLHPLRATQATATEMSVFAQMLDRATWVGEVGLDGSREGKATLRVQRQVFEHLLQQPRMQAKALTVHSRGAEAEVVDLLAQAGVRGVMHWYSGALKSLDAGLAAGLYFSVNPAMLRSKNGQRVIAALPADRVLCETDGPWCTVSGRPAEPRDIPNVVRGLARQWDMDVERARQRVQGNLAQLMTAR